MSCKSANYIINLWDWSIAKKRWWCNFRWLLTYHRIFYLYVYLCALLDAFFIIFTFHTARSIGFKRMRLHKYFEVSYLVGSLPKKLCIFLLLLSASPNINTCHKAACCVRFRILLWANLSWCSKAEGPLTPACWLSLHCLPAACCHGYFSSVAGRYSSSLMYDTASFTKHQCFCVAVIISHLLDAFCSPHQLSPGFVMARLDQNEETDRCNWSTRTCSRVQLQFSERVACIGYLCKWMLI